MATVHQEQHRPRSRKRTFFGLSLLSLLGMGLLFAFLVFLLDPRLRQISPYVSPIVGLFGAVVLGYLMAGLTLAAVAAYTGRPSLGKGKRRHWATKLLLPVTVMMGRIVGLKKEEIQRSFLEVNNALTQTKLLNRIDPEAPILVLVPHCLQSSSCSIRVTADLRKCKACGKCDLGELRELMDEMPNVTIAVATGGEVARQIVKKTLPQLIIAVACERDLTEGIRDIPQLPVVGILNHRPNGPCRDTKVDVQLIKETLIKVRREGKIPV